MLPDEDEWLRQYDATTAAALAAFGRRQDAAWAYLGRRLELSETVRRRVTGPAPDLDDAWRDYQHALTKHRERDTP